MHVTPAPKIKRNSIEFAISLGFFNNNNITCEVDLNLFLTLTLALASVLVVFQFQKSIATNVKRIYTARADQYYRYT